MGLRSVNNAVRRHVNCVVHSYGQVQQFFVTTPCRSLRRELLVVGDGQGNSMVVSIYWVRMRSVAGAIRLRDLADTPGTGNVSPLAGALLGLADIRFTGKHYDSRRSGALVVIAETEPVIGRPDDEVLNAAADLAVEFPP